MEKFIVERDGDLDLQFVGEKIVSVSETIGSTEITIDLFKTIGGDFVISKTQNDSLWGSNNDAGVFSTVDQIIKFLRDDDDYLDNISKKVLKQAHEKCEEFNNAYIINID